MSMDGSTTVKQRWVLRTFFVHVFVTAIAAMPLAMVGEDWWGTDLALGFGLLTGGTIGGVVSFIYGRRRGGGAVGVATVSAIYPVMGIVVVIAEAA